MLFAILRRMQLRLSGEFLARANAWLMTGAQEVDPHKITLLRNIEANKIIV